jgi:hypothetical protein
MEDYLQRNSNDGNDHQRGQQTNHCDTTTPVSLEVDPHLAAELLSHMPIKAR